MRKRDEQGKTREGHTKTCNVVASFTTVKLHRLKSRCMVARQIDKLSCEPP